MTDMVYTRHAEIRMQQRGTRKTDIALILRVGTQVDDECWILLRRDVAREIEIRQREIQALERLANRKVVVREDHALTNYPSKLMDQKRTLRYSRQQGWAK